MVQKRTFIWVQLCAYGNCPLTMLKIHRELRFNSTIQASFFDAPKIIPIKKFENFVDQFPVKNLNLGS